VVERYDLTDIKQRLLLLLFRLSEFCAKKIENSVHVMCKFCAHIREFCTLFQTNFSTLKLSVALLYNLKLKESIVNL